MDQTTRPSVNKGRVGRNNIRMEQCQLETDRYTQRERARERERGGERKRERERESVIERTTERERESARTRARERERGEERGRERARVRDRENNRARESARARAREIRWEGSECEDRRQGERVRVRTTSATMRCSNQFRSGLVQLERTAVRNRESGYRLKS